METIEIIYLEKVSKSDLPKLSSSAQRLIKKAIEERLMTEPLSYGKPLSGDLKNHRRLRVSKYRIIYKVENAKVIILAIGIRDKIYG